MGIEVHQCPLAAAFFASPNRAQASASRLRKAARLACGALGGSPTEASGRGRAATPQRPGTPASPGQPAPDQPVTPRSAL